jgi:phosphate/sulfate permease
MSAELTLPALIGLIAVALAFDFLNGLHDTANSIATLVSTRMLRPRYAVIGPHFSILLHSWSLGSRSPGQSVLASYRQT